MQIITIGSIEFLAYRPEKVASVPALNISAQGTPTFNKLMRDVLQRKIMFFATKDGERIAIQNTEDAQAFTVPANGSIKAPSFIRGLAAAGVTFPARYEMVQDGPYWIGTRVPVQPTTPLPDKAVNKPRKKGLKDMLP